MLKEDRHNPNKTLPERDTMNHLHLLITMADVADDHQHVIVGATGPARESGKSHVHPVRLRTSFDPKDEDSHWHIINKNTGPAMDLPNGEHTHFVHGETSYDNGHRHCFSSVTDLSPDNEDCEEDEYDTECDTECENECDYNYHKHRE